MQLVIDCEKLCSSWFHWGSRTHYRSPPGLYHNMEVGLSRRDAMRAIGMFGQVLSGLVRWCLA